MATYKNRAESYSFGATPGTIVRLPDLLKFVQLRDIYCKVVDPYSPRDISACAPATLSAMPTHSVSPSPFRVRPSDSDVGRDADATSEVFGRVRRGGGVGRDAGGRDVNFEKSGRDCVFSFERGQTGWMPSLWSKTRGI